MIVVQSKSLIPSVAIEVDQFCQFAFGNTTFQNVIVQFETFDPSYLTMAVTDVQPIGVVVTYNVGQQEPLETILSVLAHEAIHVRQLSEKRLQYVLLRNEGAIEWGFLWEGQPYFYPKTALEVLTLPWEKEAYSQSQGIIDEYYSYFKKVLKAA